MDIKKYLELKRRTERQISEFWGELRRTYNGNYEAMMEAAKRLLDETMQEYEKREKEMEDEKRKK